MSNILDTIYLETGFSHYALESSFIKFKCISLKIDIILKIN
jgi:hypothetical protein